ncbi:MAG: hypothetical protein WDW38_001270 [Sanguina aurantia]
MAVHVPGTHRLPQLFAASLAATLIAAPLTSALLTRRTSKRGGNHELLCRLMALVLLGFHVAMSFAQPSIASNDVPPGRGSMPLAAVSGSESLLTGAARSRARSGSGSGSGSDGGSGGGSEKRRRLSSVAAGGGAKMTHLQSWVFAVFYVSLNAQNLVLTSALWALAADVFSPEAGMRVFGFLSAGATLGQLVSSLTAVAYSRLHASWFGNSALPPLALLPLAALLLLVAGRCCTSMASHSQLLTAGAAAHTAAGHVKGAGPNAGGDTAGGHAQVQHEQQLLQPRASASKPQQRRSPEDPTDPATRHQVLHWSDQHRFTS